MGYKNKTLLDKSMTFETSVAKAQKIFYCMDVYVPDFDQYLYISDYLQTMLVCLSSSMWTGNGFHVVK